MKAFENIFPTTYHKVNSIKGKGVYEAHKHEVYFHSFDMIFTDGGQNPRLY